MRSTDCKLLLEDRFNNSRYTDPLVSQWLWVTTWPRLAKHWIVTINAVTLDLDPGTQIKLSRIILPDYKWGFHDIFWIFFVRCEVIQSFHDIIRTLNQKTIGVFLDIVTEVCIFPTLFNEGFKERKCRYPSLFILNVIL